jgi:hypothetical protein
MVPDMGEWDVSLPCLERFSNARAGGIGRAARSGLARVPVHAGLDRRCMTLTMVSKH